MSGRFKRAITRLKTPLNARVQNHNGVSGSARSVRGESSSKRGYGYRWQQQRKEYLALNPFCAMCSTDENPVLATVLDHIRPHGGDMRLFWAVDNWQGLCVHCHSSIKQREENQARKKQ